MTVIEGILTDEFMNSNQYIKPLLTLLSFQFEKFQRDTAGICRACMQLNCQGLEDEEMKEIPGYNR